MQMQFKYENKYSTLMIKVTKMTRRFYKLRSHFSSQLPVMSPLTSAGPDWGVVLWHEQAVTPQYHV